MYSSGIYKMKPSDQHRPALPTRLRPFVMTFVLQEFTEARMLSCHLPIYEHLSIFSGLKRGFSCVFRGCEMLRCRSWVRDLARLLFSHLHLLRLQVLELSSGGASPV